MASHIVHASWLRSPVATDVWGPGATGPVLRIFPGGRVRVITTAGRVCPLSTFLAPAAPGHSKTQIIGATLSTMLTPVRR